jgi:hypothetical protein
LIHRPHALAYDYPAGKDNHFLIRLWHEPGKFGLGAMDFAKYFLDMPGNRRFSGACEIRPGINKEVAVAPLRDLHCLSAPQQPGLINLDPDG